MTPVTGLVPVSYHQFGVADWAVVPFPTSVGAMKLVEPAVGGAIVHTGIAAGFVHVSVEVRTDAPGGVDDSWEEITEVSLDEAPPAPPHPGGAELLRLSREHLGIDPEPRGFRIVALMSGVTDPFPILNPAGGACRLRVHARGREINGDGTDLEPHEEYMLVAWPGPMSEEVVHKPLLDFGSS